MALRINEFCYFKYQIGPNLIVTVRTRGVTGISSSSGPRYESPIIESWQGTGSMYSNVSQFSLLERAKGYIVNNAAVTESINVEGDTFSVIAYQQSDIEYAPYSDGVTKWTWNTGDIYLDRTISRWTLNVPNGVTNIAEYFLSGGPVKNIILPEGLTSIGTYSFSNAVGSDYIAGCAIIIPSTVTSIDSYAFQNNESINAIEFAYGSTITKNQIGTRAFYCNTSTPTTVATDISELRNTNYWSTYFKRAATFIDPTPPGPTPSAVGEYRCYDNVNGEQVFRLYDSPQEGYNRVFGVEINGQMTNLYLPMTDINDTTNGGNRVQYVEGVGSMRFKY